MRDSSTYQAILDEGRAEGRAEGERRLLLLFGESRFGPPDAATRSALEAITDAEILGTARPSLDDRVELGRAARHTLTSWQMLATGTERAGRERESFRFERPG